MLKTEATTEKLPDIAIPPDAPLAEPLVLPRRNGHPWTAADLLRLADAERRFELVRGDLQMMSPASPVHGRYAMRLAGALHNYVDEHDLGEVYTAEPGFKLQSGAEETVRCPDVAFVCKERIPPEAQQQGFWEMAPDLAVEIISPSETAAEIQHKVQDYLAAGTRLVWLVYPRTHTVLEYQAGGQIRQAGMDGHLEGGDLIPGFRYAVGQLFR